ncbi:translocator protein, LysE family [Eubacterium nodatum ATCC 33099]|nr:translocator protein, LysE family [Eubacterium nodatum ATCC 33099]
MIYFVKGLMLGFAYVAPIGVQNLFAVNTSLTQTKKRAYITAFVIMFFDITLSIACFLGAGAVMSASKWLELIIMGIGSLVVIYIGYSIIKSEANMDGNTDVDIPLAKVITTACVVTWFNPQALIDGTMLLGASKAAIPQAYGYVFILGVCVASASWWFGLTTIITLFKAKITSKIFRVINIVCGAFILFYGANLLWDFIKLAKTM